MNLSALRTRKVFLVLSLTLIPLVRAKWYNSIAGPFRVVIHRWEKCPPGLEAKQKIDYCIRDARTKYNQQLRLSGWGSMPFDFNDSLSARLRIASWSNMGGWKDNAHILNFKEVCKSLDFMVKPLWTSLLKNVFGEKIPCPFMPGMFRIENLTLECGQIPIQQFLYGRWRCDTQILHKNGGVAACIRVYCDTVPI